MRRGELVVGGQYATDSGLHVEVVSTEAGMGVKDGQHVEAKRFEQRYVHGRGRMPFQTNPNIAIWVIDEKGQKNAAVIDPRRIKEPWKAHETALTKEQAKFKDAQRTRRALTAAARQKGLPPVTVDMAAGTATMKVTSLARYLNVPLHT